MKMIKHRSIIYLVSCKKIYQTFPKTITENDFQDIWLPVFCKLQYAFLKFLYIPPIPFVIVKIYFPLPQTSN